MGRESFVTLATNDEYGVGALVLAASLKQSETSKELTILVTPGLSSHMRELLCNTYDNVIEVQPVITKSWSNPVISGRTELIETFTKIQVWSLIQFTKVVFMDADTLVLQNVDELFNRFEFTAAPDPLWPDCFNAGVFVLEPTMNTYNGLLRMLFDSGSFDGREQGLLNTYFSNWLEGDISHRLPCIYNCICRISDDTNFEFYTSRSAWVYFGGSIRVVHFAGPIKPWHKTSAAKTCSQAAFRTFFNTEKNRRSICRVAGMLAYWWSLFLILVRPKLYPDMYLSHISLDSLRKYDPIQDSFNRCDQSHLYTNENLSYNHNNSFTQMYPSPHEEYIDNANRRNHSLITPEDNLQLPYHPEFHDTNWDYLHRGQRIDESNRFVEHHQTCVETPLPPQFDLSLSGVNYCREEHTMKKNSSHENQYHANDHEYQQHEISHKLDEKHSSHHENPPFNHYTDREEFHEHHFEKNNLDIVQHHGTTEQNNQQYESDIVKDDFQHKTEPQSQEPKSADIQAIPKQPSPTSVANASLINSVQSESVEKSKSASQYSLNCHKCYEKLIREHQRLLCPIRMRKLSSGYNSKTRQVFKKHRRYSFETSFKPTMKTFHPIKSDCKKLTKTTSLTDMLKKKLIKNDSKNFSVSCNTLPNNFDLGAEQLQRFPIVNFGFETNYKHRITNNRSSNIQLNQTLELNNQLSNQYRGLDIAYLNGKQFDHIITTTTTTNVTTHSKRKPHHQNFKSCLYNEDNLKRKRNNILSSHLKQSYSAENIIQLDNDTMITSSHSTDYLNQAKAKRSSSICNGLQTNDATIPNPMKFDQKTWQSKVKRKTKHGCPRKLYENQLINHESLNKGYHKSNSFNRMIATGIAGDLANIDYGAKNLCLYHTQLEIESNERMYAWERGEIDYTGIDRFINILNKLCITLRNIGGDTNLPIGTDIMNE
uniref:glycogenin glucosyltransferase n=1 Tax=Schistosoma mansoni TaxID=6183 RepID=A0A3Q0KQX0_SCHMA